MLVTYFDEVKYNAPAQRYYWLGALCASAEEIWRMEAAVSALSAEVFGSSTLARSTEFHAADIFHRKANFKSWGDISKRLDVLKRLLSIIGSESDLGKIYVRIDPSKMVKSGHESDAFMFLVERVELHLRAKKSPGIMIGDKESDSVSGTFAESLSHYRSRGTSYVFGKELTHLIDTVHFTDSHHSRMIQLADVFVWALQFVHSGDHTSYPRKELSEFIRNETNLLRVSRYKEWPTEHSWYRVGG